MLTACAFLVTFTRRPFPGEGGTYISGLETLVQGLKTSCLKLNIFVHFKNRKYSKNFIANAFLQNGMAFEECIFRNALFPKTVYLPILIIMGVPAGRSSISEIRDRTAGSLYSMTYYIIYNMFRGDGGTVDEDVQQQHYYYYYFYIHTIIVIITTVCVQVNRLHFYIICMQRRRPRRRRVTISYYYYYYY